LKEAKPGVETWLMRERNGDEILLTFEEVLVTDFNKPDPTK